LIDQKQSRTKKGDWAVWLNWLQTGHVQGGGKKGHGLPFAKEGGGGKTEGSISKGRLKKKSRQLLDTRPTRSQGGKKRKNGVRQAGGKTDPRRG